MWKPGIMIVVAGALLILTPPWVHGDELSDLKDQLEQVVSQNAKLQTQLQAQQSLTNELLERVQAVESKEASLSQEVRRVASRPAAPAVIEELPEIPIIFGPQLTIKGFGDVGFRYLTGDIDETAFYIGAQDLFFSSKLNDRLNFLLEADLHYHDLDPFDLFAHFHLERANLKYAISDLFNVKIGKIHTPIGYWNQAFHHGSWLQTSIFRPEFVEFEVPFVAGNSHGGWLPMHSIGIDLFGTKETEVGDVGYHVGVFNGRSTFFALMENVHDNNDFKGINVLLSLKPNAVEGLEVGIDYYIDVIPRSTTLIPISWTKIDEVILGGYAAYVHRGVELLGESYWIHHDVKDCVGCESGASADSWGGYAQAGYQMDKFTPYCRFDYIDVDSSPAWFGHERKDTVYTLGLRWDILDWNAVKFEYSFTSAQIGKDQQSLTLNTSYAF